MSLPIEQSALTERKLDFFVFNTSLAYSIRFYFQLPLFKCKTYICLLLTCGALYVQFLNINTNTLLPNQGQKLQLLLLVNVPKSRVFDMVKMSERHRKQRYYHRIHKRKRMKKRVFYTLLTTFFCMGIAALISIGTSDVYAVTGKITVYIFAGGILAFVVFLFMYQMTTRGRRQIRTKII